MLIQVLNEGQHQSSNSFLIESNVHLQLAKDNRKDEYFTRIEDIEKELRYYDFSNKIVYCNCDDYYKSNFFNYFYTNFDELKLKKLIVTGIKGTKVEVTRKHNELLFTKLSGDSNYKAGDFRSAECIEILKEADIVVTNPPFSIFRELFNLLIQHKKAFILLANILACAYKNVFPHFVSDTVRLGVNKVKYFHDGGLTKKTRNVVSSYWITTLSVPEKPFLQLYKSYSPKKYSKFVNYKAVNVDSLDDIPNDYYGVIGVPITILAHHNPKQFKILGTTKAEYQKALKRYVPDLNTTTAIVEEDGKYKKKFTRVFIQRI